MAAGDEVLVSVNFHDDATFWYERINQGEYALQATLEAGDTATAEHVTILDGNGDRNVGHLFSGRVWTKTYRIRVHEDAPVGTYQFSIVFQYFKDGEPTIDSQREYFTMPVTKEGIILDLANIVTTPAEVRPGDNYVVLETFIENAGRKDAKAVEFTLELPEGFSAPYANNNRVWVGYLAATEQQAMTTHLNVGESVAPGVYALDARLVYRDENDNRYEKSVSIPFLVREKPVLVITASEGSVPAGGKGELRLTVKNIGTERAEAVDVRLIKESGQPFTFDARSDFVGTIRPGEEAVAVFGIGAQGGAAEKSHSFTALVRAKGDSDKGDDNIYTFSREASVTVTPRGANHLLWLGVGLVAAVLLVVGGNLLRRRKRDLREGRGRR